MLLWLSAIYVGGCAVRSLLPMIDVPRYCLHDTPVSRIVVGRSVATVAELAFVAQWALLMHEAGASRAALAVFLIIVVAEALSWLAVLTRNDLFHAAENALSTVAAALAALFLASRWTYTGELGRTVIVIAIACAALYVAFMSLYVVPMYVRRWGSAVSISRSRTGCVKCSGAARSNTTGRSGGRTPPGSRPISPLPCGRASRWRTCRR